MTAEFRTPGIAVRRVAGVVIEAFHGDADIEEPGPGWRWVDRDAEWVREDNRVVVKRIGGTWTAWARAERHILWDMIAAGAAEDDGRRLYMSVGDPKESLWAAVIAAGAMFDVLPSPLPEPEPLPRHADNGAN